MLGEDYEEEFEPRKSDFFKIKNNKNSSKNENESDYMEYSADRSRDGKKGKQKKHKKKAICDNCKALNQKINELEQLNEELLKIKDKLSKSNENLTSKNKELLSLNKKLREENEELSNKNSELSEEKTGYKTEISGLKKQLMAKINELSVLSKEKDTMTNISSNDKISNEKQDNKNNTLNVDIMSLNSDSIPPKKEEIANSNSNKSNKLETNINNMNIMNDSKYCTIDDYNDLKAIVDELKEKVINLEKWKKNFSSGEKTRKKSRDRKNNLSIDNEKRDYSIKGIEKKSSRRSIDNIDKLSKSFTIEQKARNNSVYEDNYSLNFNLENNESKKDSNSKNNKSSSKTEKDSIKEKNKEIEKVKNKNQKFNSKIISNVEDLDLIARGLVKDDIDSLKNLKVGYKLIYRASEHGEKAEDFHERCDEIEGTLTIIKTTEGNIFGGYTSLSWDPEDESEKKDNDSFVFSLNLEKLYFESGKNEYSIFCDKSKGPCFVGMFSVAENFFRNRSYVAPWEIQCFDGETTKYEINKGKKDFFIEELEVFQVIVKKN